MTAKYHLTDRDQRAMDAASVILTRDGLDPLSLMNALTTWEDPPPHDERWEKALAAACEMAVAFCKFANNLKHENT